MTREEAIEILNTTSFFGRSMDDIDGAIEMAVKALSAIDDIKAVKSEMCDKYCKYPEKPIPEGKTEDWLWIDDDSPCINCPLNKL